VTVILPCIPETNVGEANTAPGEECSQTGKRLKPVESDGSTSVQGHEGERRPKEDEDSGPQGSASAVNVREEARSITLLSKRTQCTRATVDTRETDGNDRQHDDDVGKVGESDNASALGNNDEGRGLDIDEGAIAKEIGVVMFDEQTDESERQDIEESNAPEDLLDRRGQRPRRVLRFSSSKTDELSARERKCSGDKDATESDKAGESARIRPCFAPLVSIVAVTLVS
jgi:hypothetical protein